MKVGEKTNFGRLAKIFQICSILILKIGSQHPTHRAVSNSTVDYEPVKTGQVH